MHACVPFISICTVKVATKKSALDIRVVRTYTIIFKIEQTGSNQFQSIFSEIVRDNSDTQSFLAPGKEGRIHSFIHLSGRRGSFFSYSNVNKKKAKKKALRLTKKCK